MLYSRFCRVRSTCKKHWGLYLYNKTNLTLNLIFIPSMKYNYLYQAGLVALFAISACKAPSNQNAPLPPTPVAVTEARTAEAVYYDQFQGTVVALNSVELRSQVTGFITGIFFKEGEVVQKGKQLYEIDRRKYVAAYDQAVANLSGAEANLVKAQKDIDRYNYLQKEDAVARQTVDQAQA